MTNSLINIANVLAERVGEKSPTQLQDMVIDNGVKKQLNYEIMFQLLMGECETNQWRACAIGVPTLQGSFKPRTQNKFLTLPGAR